MKKVLMVATVPSMIGQFNMNNIQILLDMGYEVHVACNFNDRSVWEKDKIEELEEKLLNLRVGKIQVEFARTPYNLPKLIKSYSKLHSILTKQEYCVLHCHTPIAGMIARLASLGTKTKVIYTAHGFHFFNGAPLKNWIIYYPVEKVCSYLTDTLITINKEDYVLAQNKMHAKTVEYIPGVGVDLDRFKYYDVDREKIREAIGIPEKGFMMISVGELSSRKNHQIVIKALAKLKNPDIYYCIAGIGSDKCEYEKLIVSSHLEKNVFLLGHRTDIAELCLASDCFVHPSIREGLGVAPLEGMACGLPLISSYVNGIKDYTEDGVSGCCVNPTDCGEMVRAIEKMYNDPEFCKNCGKNNKEMVQNFSLIKSQKVMNMIYTKIFLK